MLSLICYSYYCHYCHYCYYCYYCHCRQDPHLEVKIEVETLEVTMVEVVVLDVVLNLELLEG